jgi:hypothetical protein
MPGHEGRRHAPHGQSFSAGVRTARNRPRRYDRRGRRGSRCDPRRHVERNDVGPRPSRCGRSNHGYRRRGRRSNPNQTRWYWGWNCNHCGCRRALNEPRCLNRGIRDVRGPLGHVRGRRGWRGLNRDTTTGEPADTERQSQRNAGVHSPSCVPSPDFLPRRLTSAQRSSRFFVGCRRFVEQSRPRNGQADSEFGTATARIAIGDFSAVFDRDAFGNR